MAESSAHSASTEQSRTAKSLTSRFKPPYCGIERKNNHTESKNWDFPLIFTEKFLTLSDYYFIFENYGTTKYRRLGSRLFGNDSGWNTTLFARA
jgi:hypothetical protein